MSELTLSIAQAIITEALSHARFRKLKPLAIVVLDDRGAVKAAVSEDGTSLRRYEDIGSDACARRDAPVN